jgi:hypothetical protein
VALRVALLVLLHRRLNDGASFGQVGAVPVVNEGDGEIVDETLAVGTRSHLKSLSAW